MRKGRFPNQLAEVARRFSESISFDWRLYRHDIAGSIAHAAALRAAGIITSAERDEIESGLRQIEKEIAAGKFSWDVALEDVHMNIEAALTRRIGDAGAKLHTARSRNDQIALDLRLYVKEQIATATSLLKQFQGVLLNGAEKHVSVIMPGYTHLQRAQPIYFAHYLLGHIGAFQRDIERLGDCLQRTDVLPLGSGALAGSTIVLNRRLVARELGFSRISENSVDAVSDRDFVCEFLCALALIGMHLSRLSEDFVLWSTAEFGFIEFSDAFSTGSSLMPQKKNPDMAELTRGKTGRVYGNLLSILTALKGLPSSYNRDLQEDKHPLFDSVDTVTAILELWIAMLPAIKIDRARMEIAASDPALLATDLAEEFVRRGIPFREAHELVGKLAARSAKLKLPLNKLSATQLRAISPYFGRDIAELFDPRRSLEKRNAPGAPSPRNIKAQLKAWHQRLKQKQVRRR